MDRRRLFLSAVLVSLSSWAGFAEERLWELEGIVVTATRTPETLRAIPWGVSVISDEEIEIRRPGDLGELLRGELGIDIRSYGALGQAATVSLRGSTANQVLVLVDGRPVNHIALGVSDLSLLPLDAVQRVEIVRGPISSLYGANALGGVVNVITKKMSADAWVREQASFGSLDREAFETDLGFRAGKIGLLLSGSSKSTQGPRSNSACETDNGMVKVSYGERDSDQLSLSLGLGRRALGVPGPKPAPGEAPIYGDSTATSVFDTEKDKNLSADLSLSLRPGAVVRMEAKAYLDRRTMHFFSVFEGLNPDWTTYRAELNDDYLTRTLGGNLQFTIPVSPDQKFLMGLDARKDQFEGTSELRNSETGVADTTEWTPLSKSYGIWAEAKRTLLQALTATTGLRYDKSEAYGSSFSPSVGLVLRFGNNALKLSAGKAFRAPTFNDLYWPGAGNPDLRPESGIQEELRAESFPFTSLSTSAAVFRRDVKDMISWAPLGQGGRWQPSNIDRFSETGSEFEIKARPASSLSLDAGVTLLSARQTKMEIVFYDFMSGELRLDERTRVAAYVPALSGSASLTYGTGFGTTLTGELRWVGERVNYYPDYSQAPVVTMDEKRLPGALLLGGRVSQRVTSFAQLFLAGENLLDKEHAEQFGNSVTDRDYPRPGRTLQGGLTLTF